MTKTKENDLFLLITPQWAHDYGSDIKLLTREQIVKAWESGEWDNLQFVDHLEFNFNTWNVHTDENKKAALLLPYDHPIIPFKTKTVVTQELNLP
jgi:hypothetical protein